MQGARRWSVRPTRSGTYGAARTADGLALNERDRSVIIAVIAVDVVQVTVDHVVDVVTVWDRFVPTPGP